jgi:hypothetical protein
VWGCSSLPGISGALAIHALQQGTTPVERVRVSLFIGNHNPKGLAAVTSLVSGLGRPIRAPQGTLLGFHDREIVPLPPPFGRRAAYNFDSPEYDIFPELLGGARTVVVKVGFELQLATEGFALLARLGAGYGKRIAPLLAWPGRCLQFLGCSGAAIQSELYLRGGEVRRAALATDRDGQRLAALPCALVAEALTLHGAIRLGAATAYEFLGAPALLEELVKAGFRMHASRRLARPLH